MNPRDFNYNKTDFRSKHEIIEHLLESEIVSKMLVLERFRENDGSVVSQDIIDNAELLWIGYQHLPQSLKRVKRKKIGKGKKVTQLKPRNEVPLARAC